MQMQRLLIYTLTAAAIGVTCAPAATITPYNRAVFQTAVNGGLLAGQTFDSLAAGTVLNTLNGVTYGASGGSAQVTNFFVTSTQPNGLGSTSQGLVYFADTESATFTFAMPITAFAIDVNTFAPNPGDYTATLNLGNVVSSRFVVFSGTETGQFIGFTSDTAFNSVTIRAIFDDAEGGAFSYTLDTLAYGNASGVTSPEPSTLGLLGAGLALFGFKLKFRSRR